MRQRVFVGSSSEAKASAAKIAQRLSEAGFTPVRWWSAFPLGSITILSLLQRAHECDAAVLLFTPDDRTWYRGDEVNTPRDNVLLEYGLFVANMGLSRTVIVAHGDAKIPSDLRAVTYEPLVDDIETVAERVADHLVQVLGSGHHSARPPALPRTIIDPALTRHLLDDRLPFEWCHRALYAGTEAAKAWLPVANEEAQRMERVAMRRQLQRACQGLHARTLVSLGATDLDRERELAVMLRESNVDLQYVPVGISQELVHNTALELCTEVNVPFAIVCDYEDGVPFVSQNLEQPIHRPGLYAMLGNAFGNIDRHERDFMSRVAHHLLRPEDLVLLQVALCGPGWSFAKDPLARHESYSPRMRRFLAQRIAQHTGEPVDQIVADFEDNVAFREGVGDVDGAKVIEILDVGPGRAPRRLMRTRRYVLSELADWLSTRAFRLRLEFSEEHLFDDTTGVGVLVLKKVLAGTLLRAG
jgi:hypothetical protein